MGWCCSFLAVPERSTGAWLGAGDEGVAVCAVCAHVHTLFITRRALQVRHLYRDFFYCPLSTLSRGLPSKPRGITGKTTTRHNLWWVCVFYKSDLCGSSRASVTVFKFRLMCWEANCSWHQAEERTEPSELSALLYLTLLCLFGPRLFYFLQRFTSDITFKDKTVCASMSVLFVPSPDVFMIDHCL